ncbi:hypothetical protein [Actinocorallia aurantiaca]|uniref:Uncharacterized protein n=1 Tax=Actinocorallia aurantiaca TaxID=46204 RepID=A0ABP6H0Q0_9ACTN
MTSAIITPATTHSAPARVWLHAIFTALASGLPFALVAYVVFYSGILDMVLG